VEFADPLGDPADPFHVAGLHVLRAPILILDLLAELLLLLEVLDRQVEEALLHMIHHVQVLLAPRLPVQLREDLLVELHILRL